MLSCFLSRIINDYADCEDNTSACKSSEEMKAALEVFNSLDEEIRKQCKIVSMDVKALYPSMLWNAMMISNSEMAIENVDWHEVGKYLAVMMTSEGILTEGLVHVIPKRKDWERRLRRITMNYLHQTKNKGK